MLALLNGTLAESGDLPTKDDWVYDTACTMTVYATDNGLIKVEDIGCINVIGIGGKTFAARAGTHRLFGRGIILDEAPFTLVSHDSIFNNYNMKFEESKGEKGEWTFRGRNGLGGLLTTRRVGKLFVIDVVEPATGEHNFDLELSEIARAFVVQELREQAKVSSNNQQVWDLHYILGHANMVTVEKMLNASEESATLYGVTSQDIRDANYCRPCVGCRLGKMTRHPVPSQTEPELQPHRWIRGEHIHADIVYCQKTLYLVAVEGTVGFGTISKIRSKAALVDAVRYIVGEYRYYNYRLRNLHFDAESTIAKWTDAHGEIKAMGLEIIQNRCGISRKYD